MKKYYLAYGSNLNLEQMMYRCPDARPIGTSEIQNYELLFKGSKTGSYLTIERENGAHVPVVVWEITERDERALDRYEGFPDFYYKVPMALPVRLLRTGKTKQMETFVYIMHENRSLGVPTDYYLETCLEGYRVFGFDERLLAQAYEKSRMECLKWVENQ